MLKMADACQEANKHKQTTFQEMYVQRHNNVRYVIKIALLVCACLVVTKGIAARGIPPIVIILIPNVTRVPFIVAQI